MVSNVTGILAGERRGLTGNETVSGLKLVGYVIQITFVF